MITSSDTWNWRNLIPRKREVLLRDMKFAQSGTFQEAEVECWEMVEADRFRIWGRIEGGMADIKYEKRRKQRYWVSSSWQPATMYRRWEDDYK